MNKELHCIIAALVLPQVASQLAVNNVTPYPDITDIRVLTTASELADKLIQIVKKRKLEEDNDKSLTQSLKSDGDGEKNIQGNQEEIQQSNR